jgi:hypothetical protein
MLIRFRNFRYQSIQRALHFVNNEEVPATNTDRFVKLGNFMTKIISNFQTAINPRMYLCIDETLLKFYGRLSFRQYNPKKRSRFGIKMFILCDCALKFVWDILPYQGKSTQIADRSLIQSLGFGGAAVMTLMQGLLGKAHRVVVDNWFLGPKLAMQLKNLGTYVLGTVQKRRKGMPKLRGKLKKWQIDTYTDDHILIERYD